MTNENLKQICHVLGGLLIMLSAFQFYESGLQDLVSLYLAMGVVFIVIAFLPKVLDLIFGRLSTVFFLAEAGALFYSARHLHTEVDEIVGNVITLAALGYLILAFYFLFSKKPK